MKNAFVRDEGVLSARATAFWFYRPGVRDQFNSMKKDLGYGLLLKRIRQTWLMRLKRRFNRQPKTPSACSAAVLRVPYHGGVWLPVLAIIALSFWSVIRNRIGEKNGCCAPRCTVFRCRGLL